MTSRDFCYWLQGYLELATAAGKCGSLDVAQVRCIRKHLALVFKHEIDPTAGDEKHQKELNDIHDDEGGGFSGGGDHTVYRC